MHYDDILQQLCGQYEACEREFKNRFDLKPLTFYIMSVGSNQQRGNGAELDSIMDNEKKVKGMSNWVQKCGGGMRLSLDDSVSVAILELSKIH